jgi:NADP-dependent 3-hydroxy acid dehydrogenase YdfG
MDERAHEAIDDLKADTRKDSVFLLNLDLTNLDSIKEAADEFIKMEPELHMLYNSE